MNSIFIVKQGKTFSSCGVNSLIFSFCATEELKLYKDNVDPADMTSLKKPTTEHDPALKFKSADDTKLFDFIPGDFSKQFSISANLDPK